MLVEDLKLVFKEADIQLLFDTLIETPSLIDYAFNIACTYDDYYVIKSIYDLKPSLDLSDGFVSACCSGHLNIVKNILRLNKLDFKKDTYIEALYTSCLGEKIDIIKYLISLKPDILKSNIVFEKAYLNAVFTGNRELINEILKYNPNK